MVQDVYDISDLVGAGDSNITDAEIVEEARGIKYIKSSKKLRAFPVLSL